MDQVFINVGLVALALLGGAYIEKRKPGQGLFIVLATTGAICLLVGVVLTLTKADAQPPSVTVTTPERFATKVRTYNPTHGSAVSPDLTVTESKRHASCWIGASADQNRGDAFRCMAGHGIFDPCFRIILTKLYVCPRTPWADSVVVLHADDPPPERNEDGSKPERPWALVLEGNNLRCRSNGSGAGDVVANQRATYWCGDGEGEGGLILGDLVKVGRTWYATYIVSLDATSATLLPVREVWY
jgi:hypothetical protein